MRIQKSVPANMLALETMKLCNAILDQNSFAMEYRILIQNGWQFFVVDQDRGRCYYDRKWITIPKWALHCETTKPGHWVWYVAHEISHACVGIGHKHGQVFMHCLKRICPPEFLHYELGYKPRNASVAGIRKIDADRTAQNWDIDLMDLL